LEKENAWKFDWDEANVAHIGRHDVSPIEVEDAFRNGLMELDYEETWRATMDVARPHERSSRYRSHLDGAGRCRAPNNGKACCAFRGACLLGEEANVDY
jgi:hypothetical protein